MNEKQPRPWEHDACSNYEAIVQGLVRVPDYIYNRILHGPREYTATYRNLENYDHTYWKLGDIVKFSSGYKEYMINNDWRYWYYQGKDKENFIKTNCARIKDIPYYAQNQIAILLGRYKWIKMKWRGTYTDYGSVIMMLTGSHIGHVRRYYVKNPWTRIDSYPYTHIPNHIELFGGVPVGSNVKEFLENLMEKFT